MFGSWSLDQISLDLFSRSKVSLKFGSRLNVFFGTWSNVLIILTVFGTRSKVLIMVFNFQSSDKSCKFFFGTRSKVLIIEN
jgi:hypothetical protein